MKELIKHGQIDRGGGVTPEEEVNLGAYVEAINTCFTMQGKREGLLISLPEGVNQERLAGLFGGTTHLLLEAEALARGEQPRMRLHKDKQGIIVTGYKAEFAKQVLAADPDPTDVVRGTGENRLESFVRAYWLDNLTESRERKTPYKEVVVLSEGRPDVHVLGLGFEWVSGPFVHAWELKQQGDRVSIKKLESSEDENWEPIWKETDYSH